MLRFYLLAGLLAAATLDAALAQQPTQAQRDAIRASCRSDFIENCSGVQPGGREALECLMRNDAKLSTACKEAVSAVAAKPAEAAEPPSPAASAPPEAKPEAPAATSAPSSDEALKDVQKACTLNDVMAHCSWIAPTNPEILLCLKANAAELSPDCQAVVQSLPAATAPVVAEPKPVVPAPAPPEPTRRAEPIKKPVEPPRPSAPPAAAPAAAPAQPPTEQQKAAIRAACRSDFMAHCAGVQPGGREALQCLQRNAASLSGRCQSAVAAIGGGGGGAAPSAGAPSAAAPPAAAPIGPIPMMRPRDALAIVQICRAEARTLCAGTPFGGGRILNCLAENAGSLSPECYSALSAAARQ
jgi:hypothetical protein